MALTRGIRAHPVWFGLGFLILAAAGSAAWVWKTQFVVEDSVVYYGVPTAPHLTATGPDQTVFRIDPSRSKVTYEAEEVLAGTRHVATAMTKGVAGDVLVDDARPGASKVGTVVVNVQQFTSDQKLRDERIRHDYLESNTYRLARFRPTGLSGLPARIVDGKAYRVRVTGDLTVKRTTAPATLAATVTRKGDTLTIDATTTVKLSTFDAGPINLVGLARTGDEVDLRFHLVAVDAEVLGDPAEFAAAPEQEVLAVGAAGEAPSFRDSVLPVLRTSCASCHNTGEAGAQVWTLDKASDASRVAKGLGLVVKSGYMPPWPASHKSVPFAHSKELDPAEVKAFVDWAAHGGPLDVDPDTKVTPPQGTVRHPRADLTLRADAPYTGSTDLTNDYRCLVMDPKLTEPTTVTGYEFVPDQRAYVHHALVFKVGAGAREDVQARDDADPGTGYRCFGGVGAGRGRRGGGDAASGGGGGGAQLVSGWAPGQDPVVLPSGIGLHLQAGEFFVVQIHYHFVHAAPPDRSSLVLQVDPKGADYDDLRITTYLGPAEIPCGPGESGPLCDRDAVIEELNETYGPGGSLAANGLHLLCGTTPSELSHLDADGLARSSCDHAIRRPGQIVSVLGHMHQIGKAFRMTLNPDTPEEKVLLDIPDWDFDWQMNYRPKAEIDIGPGDVVRIECTWDRSRVTEARNRYVTWADGTEDEMCYSTIATREPRTAG